MTSAISHPIICNQPRGHSSIGSRAVIRIGESQASNRRGGLVRGDLEGMPACGCASLVISR